MSIIYRYYKQYRYFSHITATRVGGRLDEPEVPLGGVAAGGVVVPKYLWCGPKDAYRVKYHAHVRGMADHHEGKLNGPCTRR